MPSTTTRPTAEYGATVAALIEQYRKEADEDKHELHVSLWVSALEDYVRLHDECVVYEFSTRNYMQFEVRVHTAFDESGALRGRVLDRTIIIVPLV